MPLLTPSGKHFSLHKLMAMSTMMSSPAHGNHGFIGNHIHPLIQAGGGDALSEVSAHQLYLSNEIQDHLQRVYDNLRGQDKALSHDKFVDFLEKTQGQPMEGMHRELYKFEEFLEVVYYNHGFEIVKPAPPEKDLSKPISNYFISSSHNTYVSGNQLTSKSSTEAYKNVLIRGCRCIEIDVFNGEPPDSKSETSSISGAPSPKPEHARRHLSATTIAGLAVEAAEKMEAKYKSAAHTLKEKTGLGINLMSDRNKSTESVAVEEPIEKPATMKALRNGEPLVLHGWTLTAPIGFREVCKTVRETAFLTNNLPIIVSLEVHANLEQQEVMVKIMKEEWKGLLVDEAHETCDPNERVPRLDELLNKILIKVKKATPATPVAPELAAANNIQHVSPVTSSDALQHVQTAPASNTLHPEHPRHMSTTSLLPIHSRHYSTSSNSLAPVSSRSSRNGGDSASGSEDERTKEKKKAAKICENLSNLGIYTHSEHFKSFAAEASSKPSHIFSISENQILDLHEKKRAELFAHNREFFMRAYPAGFRFDSSNMDPSLFWRKGVQMVALNWQNVDEGTMLNEAMFAGEQGWVLKPQGYRSGDVTGPVLKTMKLKITVFSGQHIPMPPGQTEKGFHPYIRSELHVEKPDEHKTTEMIEGKGVSRGGEYKQKTPYGKGDHPDFGKDGVALDFPVIKNVLEELSFIRFKIEDAKYTGDALAAWACVRLDRLQRGYRFLRLLDAKGLASPGLLLVKVEKTFT